MRIFVEIMLGVMFKNRFRCWFYVEYYEVEDSSEIIRVRIYVEDNVFRF